MLFILHKPTHYLIYLSIYHQDSSNIHSGTHLARYCVVLAAARLLCNAAISIMHSKSLRANQTNLKLPVIPQRQQSLSPVPVYTLDLSLVVALYRIVEPGCLWAGRPSQTPTKTFIDLHQDRGPVYADSLVVCFHRRGETLKYTMAADKKPPMHAYTMRESTQ